jgi:uncharacterized Tic20 family protein
MTSEFSEGLPQQQERSRAEDTEPEDDDIRNAVVERHSTEDIMFGVAAHWGGYFSVIFAPLILYFVQPNRRSLGAWHAREAFNFQFTMVVYFVVDVMLFGLMFVEPLLGLIPIALFFLLGLFELVVVIIATFAAIKGYRFRCPLTIPVMQMCAWVAGFGRD